MSDTPKISLMEDGPLLVTDCPALKDENGAELPVGPTIALCRCGASKNKPYCDGAHAAIGFSSAPDHSQIRNTPVSYQGTVEGTEVTVWYTPVLCSHAGECQRAAGAVFDPSRNPWVSPSGGTMKEVMDAMAGCPSGALRISLGGAEPPQHLTDGNCEITVEPHGPYRVRNIVLEAEFNGEGASRTKFVLCRCGQSKNKPFCDGTHYDAKWRDDE